MLVHDPCFGWSFRPYFGGFSTPSKNGGRIGGLFMAGFPTHNSQNQTRRPPQASREQLFLFEVRAAEVTGVFDIGKIDRKTRLS